MINQTSIAEALRLTRRGDPLGATALLRSALTTNIDPSRASIPAEGVIDLQPEWVALERVKGDAATAGRSEARRHTGTAGSIDYLLYRPASIKPGMPLVVMLHGCTQSPEDFARGTRMNRLADEFSFLVAYPRQSQAANQQRCWNWFRPSDQSRGKGEPALIAGITRDVIAAERADTGRVYVAGMSAGGAAAAIMAEVYPDLFTAVGVHSGLACGAARDLPGALAAMKRGGAGRSRNKGARFVPVITLHGDRDGVVSEANAREIVKAATAVSDAPITVKIESGSAGGKRYTRAVTRDDAGRVLIEQWTVAGAGHAWSGGDPAGSYTDATGPDASRAMLDFFRKHCTSENGD